MGRSQFYGAGIYATKSFFIDDIIREVDKLGILLFPQLVILSSGSLFPIRNGNLFSCLEHIFNLQLILN